MYRIPTCKIVLKVLPYTEGMTYCREQKLVWKHIQTIEFHMRAMKMIGGRWDDYGW